MMPDVKSQLHIPRFVQADHRQSSQSDMWHKTHLLLKGLLPFVMGQLLVLGSRISLQLEILHTTRLVAYS